MLRAEELKSLLPFLPTPVPDNSPVSRPPIVPQVQPQVFGARAPIDETRLAKERQPASPATTKCVHPENKHPHRSVIVLPTHAHTVAQTGCSSLLPSQTAKAPQPQLLRPGTPP